MITKNNQIKCDFCSKFISFDDLKNNKAYNKLITPYSDVSFEETEACCYNCKIRGNKMSWKEKIENACKELDLSINNLMFDVLYSYNTTEGMSIYKKIFVNLDSYEKFETPYTQNIDDEVDKLIERMKESYEGI